MGNPRLIQYFVTFPCQFDRLRFTFSYFAYVQPCFTHTSPHLVSCYSLSACCRSSRLHLQSAAILYLQPKCAASLQWNLDSAW
jgi:hypothetical protein